MGRSVSTHTYASTVAYQTFGPDEEYYREMFAEEVDEGQESSSDFDTWMWNRWNAFAAQDEFDMLIEDTQDRVIELFPSMTACDRWEGRENHVVAENAHSEVSISEYCGVVAICLAQKFDYDNYYADESSVANLGAHWRKMVEEKFNKNFSEMRMLGRFSDGTAAYSLVGFAVNAEK